LPRKVETISYDSGENDFLSTLLTGLLQICNNAPPPFTTNIFANSRNDAKQKIIFISNFSTALINSIVMRSLLQTTIKAVQ